jgi:hypothetical protein
LSFQLINVTPRVSPPYFTKLNITDAAPDENRNTGFEQIGDCGGHPFFVVFGLLPQLLISA